MEFSYQGAQIVKNENFFSCTQSESNKDLTVPKTIYDEVSFTNKYSLIVTIIHSGTLNRCHYWAFIKGLHSSICTFAMTSQFLMMKKIMSTNLHHTLYIPFLQQSLSFSQDLPNIFMVCKGVLSFQRLSLGVTTPHIIPAFLWELRLLTQFSGITTLQSLILEK